MMIKKGDKIICHKKLKPYDYFNYVLTVNKEYVVEHLDEIRNQIQITNDVNFPHYFSILKRFHSYYGKWFYTKNEQRLKKMKKLKKYEKENGLSNSFRIS